MAAPEAEARVQIDALLDAAGWVLQDRERFNRKAALGVAVREYPLPTGPCDYLLFVDGKAAGVIEAKKAGTTLSGVAEQAERYVTKLPEELAAWGETLRFAYETTGDETNFRDRDDPDPRSRRVFAFHKPETLHAWLLEDETFRARLGHMPELATKGLRDCQIEAIGGLEDSLAHDRPRALIQMTMGAGKTFTACTFSYRLIKHAKAKRILFLVDRRNLGDQTLREFQNYRPPGEAHTFDDLYITQHLNSNHIDRDAKVVITTIQRLYAMLRGKELEEEAEDVSGFEGAAEPDDEVTVAYNPDLPIEEFDVIVTDECHRSIYGLWRQVLEYFDAHIVGLTATPSKHTLGFFAQNLVAEYPYERSVADGVNVGYEVYRIRTRVTEGGGKVDKGYAVGKRDRRTRRTRYEQLDDDLTYTGGDVDRSVTVPNQIRTILQAYKDNLFTELFPGRREVPKTLVFAKDDHHAEEIVGLVREVFDAGNDFCKKITYRAGESPKDLIKAFRVDYMPRIAVTVDMVATGTDVKPIEVVMFLRDVKSEQYFEQMKGRGVRSIDPTVLHDVTPDAKVKDRFVLIDAVGVTESHKGTSQPLERSRTVKFEKLMERAASGNPKDETISSLAQRLSTLDRRIEDEEDQKKIRAVAGKSLPEMANALLDAIDEDKIDQETQTVHGMAATEKQRAGIKQRLKEDACAPFEKPELRELLSEVRRRTEITIDDITTDEVLPGGFSLDEARKTTESFRAFIEDNKDELLALQILYAHPHGARRLTYAAIKDLTTALTSDPWHLTTARVWQAYKRLDASRVRGTPSDKLLTDIISLVRFATGQDDALEPFSARIDQKFNLWVGRQIKAGRAFSDDQMAWLKMIKDYLAANAEIEARDLGELPPFTDRGGLMKAQTLFGEELAPLLDEMRGALVA